MENENSSVDKEKARLGLKSIIGYMLLFGVLIFCAVMVKRNTLVTAERLYIIFGEAAELVLLSTAITFTLGLYDLVKWIGNLE